jgi:hypothetical protein
MRRLVFAVVVRAQKGSLGWMCATYLFSDSLMKRSNIASGVSGPLDELVQTANLNHRGSRKRGQGLP